LTFTASNGVGTPATQNFTLTVNAAHALTSAASTTFVAGTPGSLTVAASGSPTPTLTESGALPAGVTFVNNGNGTATLSGSPAAATQGTYALTLTAANGVTPNATQAFTLTVNGPATGVQCLVGRIQEDGRWFVAPSDGVGAFKPHFADRWDPGVTWADVQTG